MKKILVSGGHLTPALAVIDQAQLEKKPFSFIFLGREFSQENSRQISHEQEEVEKRGVRFIATTAPKLHTTYWWRNGQELAKIWPSLKTAWDIVTEEKPALFLSFGGYLAFPIALVCRVRSIPVVTHEQTSVLGLANRAISFLSTKVAVAHPGLVKEVGAYKAVVTGNPIRPKLFKTPKAPPRWLSEKELPILYITGGNQGSEVLNSVVASTIQELTKKWTVIHQCGNPTSFMDYEQRLLQAREQLSPGHQKRYYVKKWLTEDELLWIFAHARLVVSRSGANTVQELLLHKIPAVLIPLPFSHNNEQQKNADQLRSAGCAFVLAQKNLTPESFLNAIKSVSRRYVSMSQKAQQLHQQTIFDGASNVLKLIESVLKERRTLIEKK